MTPPDTLWTLVSHAMGYRDLRNALEYLLDRWQRNCPRCAYGILVQSPENGFLHVFGTCDNQRRRLEQSLIQFLLDQEEEDQAPELHSLALSVEAQACDATTEDHRHIPISSEGREAGCLLLGSERSTAPFAPPEEWAQAIGLLVQHFHQLNKASAHDYLTGLSNRAHFDEFLHRALELHQRHQLPLTLGLLDINNFKAINDKEGHNQGDILLKNFAAALQETVRESDMAARYGGDEFAILLLHTDWDNTETAVQRIEGHMRERFPEGPGLAGGWVHLAADAPSPDIASLVHQADQALYSCKATKPDCPWQIGSSRR